MHYAAPWMGVTLPALTCMHPFINSNDPATMPSRGTPILTSFYAFILHGLKVRGLHEVDQICVWIVYTVRFQQQYIVRVWSDGTSCDVNDKLQLNPICHVKHNNYVCLSVRSDRLPEFRNYDKLSWELFTDDSAISLRKCMWLQGSTVW